MESVSTDMPFELDLLHCRVDMLHVFYEFFIFVSASCNLWYSITNKSDMLNYALLGMSASPTNFLFMKRDSEELYLPTFY